MRKTKAEMLTEARDRVCHFHRVLIRATVDPPMMTRAEVERLWLLTGDLENETGHLRPIKRNPTP